MRKEKVLITLVFLIGFFVAIGNSGKVFSATDGVAVDLACKCGTTVFSTCGNNFGKTNIKWRECIRVTLGSNPDRCNWKVLLKLYQYQSCGASPTATPGPTVTPGGPTPTVNPLCKCLPTVNTCTNACTFQKFPDITTYANPIKCGVAAGKFQSNPTEANRNDWCRRQKKTKGDASGDDKISLLDYFYYVQSKAGAKVPATVNPDFNGDNDINAEDRAIIIKSL